MNTKTDSAYHMRGGGGMLSITVQNTSNKGELSDYHFEVWISTVFGTKKLIEVGDVIGHTQNEGWEVLIAKLLGEVKNMNKEKENKEKAKDLTYEQIGKLSEKEELQYYAEKYIWEKFKVVIVTLLVYKFPKEQLIEYIEEKSKIYAKEGE
jgi:hypothetical protein